MNIPPQIIWDKTDKEFFDSLKEFNYWCYANIFEYRKGIEICHQYGITGEYRKDVIIALLVHSNQSLREQLKDIHLYSPIMIRA